MKEKEALQIIRYSIQNRIQGGINLLRRIYFEGRNSLDYPIDVVDAKTRKIYYKTESDIILDENATHIKNILIDNLQNCYLRYSNFIIEHNLEHNDVIFEEYGLANIQSHIQELSDEKKKVQLITGLIDQIKKF
jgi:hypothetical protein